MWMNQELRQRLSGVTATAQSRGKCLSGRTDGRTTLCPAFLANARFLLLFWGKLRSYSNFSSYWGASHVAYCTGVMGS